MTNAEWLKQPPNPEDIREKDDAKYIPYHIIVDKLNYLCRDGWWSMKNFHHSYHHVSRGMLLISGSIEVEVTYCSYDIEYVTRTLSGAANFVVNGTSNPHVAATVKSLAIMNAVKPLGEQFGWGINGFEKEIIDPPAPEEVTEPDRVQERLEKLILKAETIEELARYKKDLTSGTRKMYMDKLKDLTNKIKINGVSETDI